MGNALTVMVTNSLSVHPFASVPVTVYVWVVVGVAFTTGPAVTSSPVDGDQEYVEAPDAVMVVVVPLHTVAVNGEALIVRLIMVT